MTVEVGDLAPDFALQDQDRSTVRLSDLRGRKVVVVFYPLSFTSTCQAELCAIRDELPDLSGEDVQVLAISVDSTAVHARWAAEQGYAFPLLADFWPHGEVARQYGVLDETSGLALRGTFVVDREGRVAWLVRNGWGARSTDDYRRVLAELA